MEYLGISAIKNAYANKIRNEQKEKAEKIIASSINTPVFSPQYLHGEDQIPVSDVNDFLTDITIDLEAIDQEIASSASRYESLLNNINQRLSAIDEVLSAEEERIMDLNAICGNYANFNRIISYTGKDVEGSVSTVNGKIFTAQATQIDSINFEIANVEGNGYEGNKYVLNKDNSFLKETSPTSNRDMMIDGNELTSYEYSRLSITDRKNGSLPDDFNSDNEDVKCAITLKSDAPFSMLNLNCTGKITIEDVCYSDDELIYTSALSKPMVLNDPSTKYNDMSVFDGTNIVCFPSTCNIKMILSSSEITGDSIGYEKIETIGESSTKSVIKLDNAYRKKIEVKELTAAAGEYSTGILTISNIITSPANSIAIFANEYIPSFVSNNKDFITYKLTVNEKEYDVVPINSNKKGVKVIRFGASPLNNEYEKNISETIKQASLKIEIKACDSGSSTPFLSNLKICLG